RPRHGEAWARHPVDTAGDGNCRCARRPPLRYGARSRVVQGHLECPRNRPVTQPSTRARHPVVVAGVCRTGAGSTMDASVASGGGWRQARRSNAANRIRQPARSMKNAAITIERCVGFHALKELETRWTALHTLDPRAGAWTHPSLLIGFHRM